MGPIGITEFAYGLAISRDASVQVRATQFCIK
jgi:hypothetical protein